MKKVKETFACKMKSLLVKNCEDGQFATQYLWRISWRITYSGWSRKNELLPMKHIDQLEV